MIQIFSWVSILPTYILLSIASNEIGNIIIPSSVGDLSSSYAAKHHHSHKISYAMHLMQIKADGFQAVK
jgi:hypothetical protein